MLKSMINLLLRTVDFFTSIIVLFHVKRESYSNQIVFFPPFAFKDFPECNENGTFWHFCCTAWMCVYFGGWPNIYDIVYAQYTIHYMLFIIRYFDIPCVYTIHAIYNWTSWHFYCIARCVFTLRDDQTYMILCVLFIIGHFDTSVERCGCVFTLGADQSPCSLFSVIPLFTI